MKNTAFNCDCFCCSKFDTCAIFRELIKIQNEYNFALQSELFDAVGRVCKYYRPKEVTSCDSPTG
jgi:hypothetical protein